MTSKKLNLVSILVALKKITKVKLIGSTDALFYMQEFLFNILICRIRKENIDFRCSDLEKYIFCFS